MGSSPHEIAEFDELTVLNYPERGVVPATPPFLPTDTAYTSSTFIETYTGRAFWPLKPAECADAFSIIDIAHALSNQCRYSGHVQFFYSTAQHCCLLASWVAEHGGSPLDCLQILMHDSPEAYLVDIPRPVKQYMPHYRKWDHAIEAEIRKWMGWENVPRLAIQDEIDTRIVVDERLALMSRSGNDWNCDELEPLGVEIMKWTPEEAEQEFLIRYAAYSKEHYGASQYFNYSWGMPLLPMANNDGATKTLDIIEVDVRGKVGRVLMRGADGHLVRDRSKGMPKPMWTWLHGPFELMERAA
jgi:hypothetical protein